MASFLIALISSVAVQAAAYSPWDAFTGVIFHHYGQEDGLPSSVATAIRQDDDGFLWVGTEGGLARWDGYRFKTYTSNAADPTTLPDSWISTLFVDARRQLWVGTGAGGLARYDRDHDRFLPYRAALSGMQIVAIADAGGGALWVGTDNGLYRLNPDTGQVAIYTHKEGNPNSLPDNRVRSLLRARDGALWIGTQSGLARLKAGASQVESVPLVSRGETPFVWALFQDDTGRIWIGTKKHGAFVTGPTDALPKPVVETSGDGSALKTGWVYAIGPGLPGEVWLGTGGQGIVVVDVASGKTRQINHEPTRLHSLASDTVWTIYRDRSGGVWIGSAGDLSRLDSSNGGVTPVSGAGRNRSLSEADVPSLMADSKGRVWAGLSSKGVDIIDLATHKVRNIVPDRSKPDKALPGSYVLSMLQWSADRVYIGTGAGLYRTDADGRHVARVKIAGREPMVRIYALVALAGKLWIGDMDDGVWAIDPDAKAPKVEHIGADRLTNPKVVSLMRVEPTTSGSGRTMA